MANTEDRAEESSRICVGVIIATRLDHLMCALQKSLDIQSHRCRGGYTERRQSGETSADLWFPVENMAKAIISSDLLHLRSRIGYSNKLLSGIFAAYFFGEQLKEILFETIRLERRARFAGDDKKRLFDIELFLDGLYLGRNRRIEDMKIRLTKCH